MFGNSSDIRINVTAETRQAQQAFTGLFTKLGEFAFYANNIVYWGKMVFKAMEDIYKIAQKGADVIGGDVAAAYAEFDANLNELEGSLQGIVARGLLPFIIAENTAAQSQRDLNTAVEEGTITQNAYTESQYSGTRGAGAAHQATVELAEGANDAADAVDDLTGAVRLWSGEIAAANSQSASWDKAMLVSAGLIESTVSPVLLAMEEDAKAARIAMSMLATAISGPLAQSAEDFASQFDDLATRSLEIKEEIADLGGLAYMTPDQQANILDLRRELIGVAMGINDIEDAYGDAFDRGATGRKVLEAADTLEDLRQTAWELEQQIIALGSKPYTTPSQLEEIDGLQKELEQVESDILATAVAQEEATRRIIFSIIQQQAALMGLLDDPTTVQFLEDLALKWGLVDQSTVDAQQAATSYLTNLNAQSGEFLGVERLAAARELGIFFEIWNEVPPEKIMNINSVIPPELIDAMEFAGGSYTTTIDIDVTGDPVPDLDFSDPGNKGTGYQGKAGGGPVNPNVPYWVGEQGPEMFVPNTSGTIIPNHQSFGGISIYVSGAGDPAAVARAVADELGNMAVRARSSGAGYTGI